jgi:hypothetical protein
MTSLSLFNFLIMRIILYLLFSVFFLTSCKQTQREDFRDHSVVYLCLNNKELETAIIDYRAEMERANAKEIAKGDSIYVGVYMKDINDSIKRYVLFPVIDYTIFRVITPFFLCTVDSKDVFFMIESGQTYYYGSENYFKLSEEEKWYFIKKYFPRRYEEYRSKGCFSNSRNYHPQNCYLTFCKDTLISKTYKRGAWRDRVQITINGEIRWY